MPIRHQAVSKALRCRYSTRHTRQTCQEFSGRIFGRCHSEDFESQVLRELQNYTCKSRAASDISQANVLWQNICTLLSAILFTVCLMKVDDAVTWS